MGEGVETRERREQGLSCGFEEEEEAEKGGGGGVGWRIEGLREGGKRN